MRLSTSLLLIPLALASSDQDVEQKQDCHGISASAEAPKNVRTPVDDLRDAFNLAFDERRGLCNDNIGFPERPECPKLASNEGEDICKSRMEAIQGSPDANRDDIYNCTDRQEPSSSLTLLETAQVCGERVRNLFFFKYQYDGSADGTDLFVEADLQYQRCIEALIRAAILDSVMDTYRFDKDSPLSESAFSRVNHAYRFVDTAQSE